MKFSSHHIFLRGGIRHCLKINKYCPHYQYIRSYVNIVYLYKYRFGTALVNLKFADKKRHFALSQKYFNLYLLWIGLSKVQSCCRQPLASSFSLLGEELPVSLPAALIIASLKSFWCRNLYANKQKQKKKINASRKVAEA